MIALLFIISVIAIPFNDFYPLLPLGEMRDELSAYLFLGTIGLYFLNQLKSKTSASSMDLATTQATQPLFKMMILFSAVVLISLIMNLPSILFGESFHERRPMSKFFTSTIVLAFGFALAYTSYKVSSRYEWRRLIIKPVGISIIICAVFAALELLARQSGAFQAVFIPLSKLVHLGFDESGDAPTIADWLTINRARSVCFEPPFLANFAGLAWPWAYAGISSAASGRKGWRSIGLLILCTALVLAANSRTGYVLLFGNLITLFLLKNVYLPARPVAHSLRLATTVFLAAAVIGGSLIFLMNTDVLEAKVIGGDSVSNITRLSSIMAAIHMFYASPLWGFGFGQYGFHAIEFLPPWAFYSYEIRDWFTGNQEIWPPVFSIYARFAAELGILGVGAWIGIWIYLARIVARVTLAYQLKTGQLLPMSYPLIMGCYGALLAGVQLDSLRSPMMWITMGLACCYIQKVRSRLQAIIDTRNN